MIGSPLSRRTFVRIGGLTAFGLGLPAFARPSFGREEAKARRCILIWLDGGPSHLETFDPKPAAPAEVRGPLAAIRTRVPGIEIGECLPRLAQQLDRTAIVRSLTSPLGEHNLGAQYLLTGYQPTPAVEYPVFGSVVAHLDKTTRPLPSHIAIPDHRVGGAKFGPTGYLPASARPFEIGGDPAKRDFRVAGLDFYPGLDGRRVARRRDYLSAIDRLGGQAESAAAAPFEPAYRLLASSAAKAAFDLARESEQTRARYGPRTIGQSTLLARRLIEAGVPLVTVNYPGWDTHDSLYTRLKEGYTGANVPVGLIPSLDLALSALLDDLHDRGLLEETLVVVMGEFGRTPKLNTLGGRDHWPRVFSVLLAGGGVPGGQVVGSSDATGESPRDRAVTPADLAATIFTLLGIDPRQTLTTADGRPIAVSTGTAVRELAG